MQSLLVRQLLVQTENLIAIINQCTVIHNLEVVATVHARRAKAIKLLRISAAVADRFNINLRPKKDCKQFKYKGESRKRVHEKMCEYIESISNSQSALRDPRTDTEAKCSLSSHGSDVTNDTDPFTETGINLNHNNRPSELYEAENDLEDAVSEDISNAEELLDYLAKLYKWTKAQFQQIVNERSKRQKVQFAPSVDMSQYHNLSRSWSSLSDDSENSSTHDSTEAARVDRSTTLHDVSLNNNN